MKRTLRGTLKLFAWLSLIVAFASYSVTPAFARMPPRNSTTSENSVPRDHKTHTKIVILAELHPEEQRHNHLDHLSVEEMKVVKNALTKAATSESLHDHLAELQIIEFKPLSTKEGFNKKSLSAEEMKALKNAVSKAAAKDCSAFEEEGGWWSCMKGCLGDVGVSAYSLIICAATCVTGAVPICAICVGVTVAVMEACGVGCALYAN